MDYFCDKAPLITLCSIPLQSHGRGAKWTKAPQIPPLLPAPAFPGQATPPEWHPHQFVQVGMADCPLDLEIHSTPGVVIEARDVPGPDLVYVDALPLWRVLNRW
jgi:hypothetical protein